LKLEINLFLILNLQPPSIGMNRHLQNKKPSSSPKQIMDKRPLHTSHNVSNDLRKLIFTLLFISSNDFCIL
jgi:hypothetical protein